MSALDNLLKSKRAEISSLKRKRRKEKSATKKAEWDDPIEDLEEQVRKFMKSRMEPARAGDIIINNKILEQFKRKLKGFVYETEVSNVSLTLRYGPSHRNWTGSLELYDPSSHFKRHGKVSKEANLNG